MSGRPPATDVAAAIEMLGERVAVYLDGGPTPGPEASTIIDFATTATGRIVRAGVLSHAVLAEVLPDLADLPDPAASADAPETAPEATTPDA